MDNWMTWNENLIHYTNWPKLFLIRQFHSKNFEPNLLLHLIRKRRNINRDNIDITAKVGVKIFWIFHRAVKAIYPDQIRKMGKLGFVS